MLLIIDYFPTKKLKKTYNFSKNPFKLEITKYVYIWLLLDLNESYYVHKKYLLSWEAVLAAVLLQFNAKG